MDNFPTLRRRGPGVVPPSFSSPVQPASNGVTFEMSCRERTVEYRSIVQAKQSRAAVSNTKLYNEQ